MHILIAAPDGSPRPRRGERIIADLIVRLGQDEHGLIRYSTWDYEWPLDSEDTTETT